MKEERPTQPKEGKAMRIRQWISLAAVSVLSACASPVNTESTVNPKVDITGYRSFAWISDKPLVARIGDSKPANPVIEKQIETAIAEGFQAKGYAMVDDRAKADFLVGFTVGSRDKLRVTTVPRAHHGYYRGLHGRRARGANYYGAPIVSTQTYTEGVLAIDVFDVKSKQPAWHGYSTKTITSHDRKNPGPVISEVVTSALTQFPSRAKVRDTSPKSR